MHICHRHLRRRDEEIVVVRHAERVLLELGKLAGAAHRIAVDHKGREHLGIPMLARVGVEEEVDDGALQARAQAAVEGEARAGNLGRSVKVQNA